MSFNPKNYYGLKPLEEEEQDDITFTRLSTPVLQVSFTTTRFVEPYLMTSCIVKDFTDGKKKMLSFYRNRKDKKKWGTEIYVGPNYVEPFDSGERSWSKNYKKNNLLPDKYKRISRILEDKNTMSNARKT